jgi:hypothetical protein
VDGRRPAQRSRCPRRGAGPARVRHRRRPVFSAALPEVGPVSWPWHWFGGGCRITVGGERYDVTFVRPDGAPAASTHLLESAQSLASVLTLGAVPGHSVAGLFDVRSGRAAGRRWKEVLPG